jgi:hypothetical protein
VNKTKTIAIILGCVIIAGIVAMGMKDGKLDESLTKFMGGFGAFMSAVIYGVLSSNGDGDSHSKPSIEKEADTVADEPEKGIE